MLKHDRIKRLIHTMTIINFILFIIVFIIYTKSNSMDNNRIQQIQRCQSEYVNCTRNCTDNSCFNNCESQLRNCIN